MVAAALVGDQGPCFRFGDSAGRDKGALTLVMLPFVDDEEEIFVTDVVVVCVRNVDSNLLLLLLWP